ncbi:hypothetical protein BJD12_14440 [Xanthomonas vesicatoria ATCC 35937]|uniref:Uncharacterized protein n=1 Tax=Xanthomonas vesicatoria ATCC 35937 TaxID=925775 RepID=F0BE07_9XANT|nr:hypothetical protein BJD12_14430 [Xanthomonas vesicatoria ATCC 35937]KTF29568.1 hypothetical protein LMG920_22065 [Xanthomonas vesicatoria]APP76223.1 hypothetical protein BJD12_14440 [Xanthomonas vesicatoria ATCC 35937]EGD09342.1 hypothetical protein XVE_2380 [Xanthomonas vesicatoria ATCC 35937]KTF29569.1 hypothetical protein LMG920_22070 [Xanthomonas vesicatoria]
MDILCYRTMWIIVLSILDEAICAVLENKAMLQLYAECAWARPNCIDLADDISSPNLGEDDVFQLLSKCAWNFHCGPNA